MQLQEESQTSNTLTNILYFFLFIIFIILISIMCYLLYLNIPGNPKSLNVIIREPLILENKSYESVKQFHPNMKFNKNKISYSIDVNCDEEKKTRILEAFNKLAKDIGKISFYATTKEPDIEISCSKNDKLIPDSDYFIAGEGGAKEIVQTGRYNIITNGIVLLYESPHKSIKCDWPNVELHELIHVFGFGHSKDPNSLMYPYLENCEQKLDESIITKLKKLYSEENFPDLYFKNVSAIKKGRYLDFNITIKNSGSIDAENVTFSVLDNGALVETRELGDLRFGAGIFVEIQNLKLIHRNPKEIKLVIDKSDNIKEIDEENNIASITFD